MQILHYRRIFVLRAVPQDRAQSSVSLSRIQDKLKRNGLPGEAIAAIPGAGEGSKDRVQM